MRRKASGFTLLDFLISVGIVAVLLGIAVPAWSTVSEAAHTSAAQSALLGSLTRSISHAALTGSEVVLCPGDAGGCRPGIDWSRGWIAYADIDGSRTRGASETLLQVEPRLGGRVHLRSTRGRTRLVFQPNGGNAGSNVTFTVCDGRGADKATTLVLANDGRLRASKPTAAAALACMEDM